MALTGYLEIERNIIYAATMEREVDTTSISLNPNDATALVRGEWLTINAANKFIRPANNAGAINPDNVTFRPALRGAAQLDVQAALGPVTVLDEVGAVVRTDMYALTGYDGIGSSVALTYAFDDALVVALALDAKGNLRSVLAPSGTTPLPSPANEGDVVAVGTNVVARVVRPPYQLTGVSKGTRKTVMDVRVL